MMRWYSEELWKWTLGTLGFVVALSLLSGCKAAKYVPMEKVVYRESVRLDTLRTMDSVWVHDSVSVFLVGDTVYKDRSHKEKVLQRVYRTKVDTCIWRDSVPVPYPVERELSKWEQFELKYAAWSMGALCALLVAMCAIIYRRIRNARNHAGNKEG